MLDGVRSGPIITGAYTSRDGTCPMLAAHRRGGRTSLATFARAWDGYTGAGRARLATERELRTLEAMLEMSLAEEGAPSGGSDLGRAIADHREARERSTRHEAADGGVASAPHRALPSRGTPVSRPGDPDRSRELRERPGWAWLRVFRRLDDYEAAVAQVLEDGVADRPEPLVGACADN